MWLLGSAKDAVIGAKIAALIGDSCVNLCGETQLGEAVLDKPLIAIYGSSDAGKTPPLSSAAKIMEVGLECSPCFQRTCRLQHYNCLREIKPQQVLYLLNTMLEK